MNSKQLNKFNSALEKALKNYKKQGLVKTIEEENIFKISYRLGKIDYANIIYLQNKKKGNKDSAWVCDNCGELDWHNVTYEEYCYLCRKKL